MSRSELCLDVIEWLHRSASAHIDSMARGGIASASEDPSPANQTPALKKSSSSMQNTKNQKTLFGFFQKTPTIASSTSSALPSSLPTISRQSSTLQTNRYACTSSSSLTPAPSSDAFDEDGSGPGEGILKESSRSGEGLLSPVSSTNGGLVGQTARGSEELTTSGTPSRKVSSPSLRLIASMLIKGRLKRNC